MSSAIFSLTHFITRAGNKCSTAAAASLTHRAGA